MRLYYDKNNVVRLASTKPIHSNMYDFVEIDKILANPIGKRIVFNKGSKSGGLRIALICNWDDACGIATYSKYLVDVLAPKVEALKIFSEKTQEAKLDTPYEVSYCWKRGETLRAAAEQVLDWKPSVVVIQHEYGIFPKATYWLQLLQLLNDTPYVVVMHSVYEHLDKTVSSGAMKNIIVHTEQGRECLKRLGNNNNIWVVPHGCVEFDDVEELWNTWHTPYPIVQFGFGFKYKGVDVALEAISLLKKLHGDKYREIFYTYFCSENKHVKNIFDDFSREVQGLIVKLGLQDNAAIVRGFQSEQSVNNCLRTSRLAIFPYVTDPKHPVYGASGAIRIAMANGVPVIASTSHMFDDMEGILPRPKNAEQLAEAIDHMFSNGSYRQGVLERSRQYVKENSWETTANRYLSVLKKVTTNDGEDVIYV